MIDEIGAEIKKYYRSKTGILLHKRASQMLIQEIIHKTLRKPQILFLPAPIALFQLASENYLQEIMQTCTSSTSDRAHEHVP